MLQWLFRSGRKAAPGGSAAGASEKIGLALQQHQAGRLEQAEALYREALELDPQNVDALHFLGVIAYQQGRHGQAEELISRALLGNSANAPAYSNLGNALEAQGKHQEAIDCYRRALVLAPDYVDALVNLGATYRAQGELDQAVSCYRRALELKPEFPAAQNNLAIALIGLGRPEEATAHCLRALQLKPDSAELKFGFSMVKLLLGDYESGLALFESRLEKEALSQAAYGALQTRMDEVRGLPRWQGEPGAGRTLLVWTDQGFGDAIMMMRYFPMLKEFGFGKVVVYCERALVRIIQSLQGVDEVVLRDQPLPARVDCHFPMTSLPFIFRTRIDTIPDRVPYLAVPVELRRKWADRLAVVASPRVGFAWAGRKDNPKDSLRSIWLGKFFPLFEIAGIKFFSLQKDEGEAEIRKTGFKLFDHMDECEDLLETSALIENLDLVISVDTVTAHLAGALGRPVWLLNRFETEWRWLLDREDSPWYPTMKIFRQSRGGSWDEVLAKVASALRARFISAQ
jgi:tetratricopeptide (TPR) repeat protein